MQEHLSPSLELAVLQRRTLPQLVQQDILSGELRAGERVNEVEIARQLGVSRGRIRRPGMRKRRGVPCRSTSSQVARACRRPFALSK